MRDDRDPRTSFCAPESSCHFQCHCIVACACYTMNSQPQWKGGRLEGLTVPLGLNLQPYPGNVTQEETEKPLVSYRDAAGGMMGGGAAETEVISPDRFDRLFEQASGNRIARPRQTTKKNRPLLAWW